MDGAGYGSRTGPTDARDARDPARGMRPTQGGWPRQPAGEHRRPYGGGDRSLAGGGAGLRHGPLSGQSTRLHDGRDRGPGAGGEPDRTREVRRVLDVRPSGRAQPLESQCDPAISRRGIGGLQAPAPVAFARLDRRSACGSTGRGLGPRDHQRRARHLASRRIEIAGSRAGGRLARARRLGLYWATTRWTALGGPAPHGRPDMTMSNRREFLRVTAGGLTLAGLVGRAAGAEATIRPGGHDVLLVVDVQNCFIPGGSLAVNGGDEIVPIINRIAPAFRNVVLTQDWHTPGHVSFASSHPGKKPFETVQLPYGTQVLWPDHCVQGTEGAALHKDLRIPHAELIIRKGYRKQMDSYSAFYEADGKTPTGLTGYLKDRGLNQVFLVGLATDFCVGWSALDARKAGFAATVIEDATRGIDAGGSLAKAWADMTGAGVKRIKSADIAV